MDPLSTIAASAVEPEVNVPDANLLQQLARIQREERHIAAVKLWLAEHHQRLVGLPWHVSAANGEIIIANLFPVEGNIRAREVASLFPGAWQCGLPCVFGDRFLDWVAERDGVTIRIQAAEKIEPASTRPLLATF